MSFDWILPVTATSNAEDSGVELCDSDNDVDDEAIDNDGLPEMIDTSAEEADLDDPHLPYLRGEEQDARGRFWWPRYPDPREFPARW